MAKIKVASVCATTVASNPQKNLQTLARWAEQAARSNADLVVFPEMYVTGLATDSAYEANLASKESFLALAEPVPGPITTELASLACRLGIFICAGMIEQEGDQCFITQVMIDPDQGVAGCYRKIQVGHCERWFSQSGNTFPVFEVRGVKVGIMLCRDKSYPEIARILALEGAQLILNPHSTLDSPQQQFTQWSLKLCTARAMENGCYLVANNNIFDPCSISDMQAGYCFAIDPYGEVIHCDNENPSQEKMVVIEVDTGIVQARREMEGQHFNLWSRTPQAYRRLIETNVMMKSSF